MLRGLTIARGRDMGSRKRLENARTRLLAERERLIALREAELSSEQELIELQESSLADTTWDQALAQRLDCLGEHHLDELQSIDLALLRMDAGVWDRCRICGEAIDLERLEATPKITTCLRCELRRDRPRASLIDRMRPARGRASEDSGAKEEPDVVTARPLLMSEPMTVRPSDEVALPREGASPDIIENLARRALEDATEAPLGDGEHEPFPDDRLSYIPDDLLPDHVREVLQGFGDDDESEPLPLPERAPKKRGRQRFANMIGRA
jgi:RNA polymerase-binding transcription factor DksA